jgi:hypothetical protein
MRISILILTIVMLTACTKANVSPGAKNARPQEGQVLATSEVADEAAPPEEPSAEAVSEPETAEPEALTTPPRERSVCTPNGLFRVKGGEIHLDVICSRLFAGGGESMWTPEPLVVARKEGRYRLPYPFKDAYLVREDSHFTLTATIYGRPGTRELHADAEGVYSFEDVVDYLAEVD